MARILQAAYGESSPIKSMGDIKELDEGSKVLEFDVEIITLPGPTRNGILYPLDEFKKAVEDPRVQDMLNRGAFYGEGEHPLDPTDMKRWTVTLPKTRQLKWTKLWFEGNKLMGTCRTFPGGSNSFYHSIKHGELPAFSIRVIGQPNDKNGYIELSNISLITIDWVGYPGNPTSYVNSSDVFNVVDIPLYNTTHTADGKYVPRSEGHDLLNVGSNEDILSLGEGYYAVVENMNKDERNRLRTCRSKSF